MQHSLWKWSNFCSNAPTKAQSCRIFWCSSLLSTQIFIFEHAWASLMIDAWFCHTRCNTNTNGLWSKFTWNERDIIFNHLSYFSWLLVKDYNFPCHFTWNGWNYEHDFFLFLQLIQKLGRGSLMKLQWHLLTHVSHPELYIISSENLEILVSSFVTTSTLGKIDAQTSFWKNKNEI